MNVLVTGGAGYIGSVVVEDLVNNGGHVVTILDNFSTGSLDALNPRCDVLVDSIGNRTRISRECKDRKIDVVMHLAASTSVGESIVSPEKYYQNNVVASLELLKGTLEGGVKKFIFSSSAAVYGEGSEKAIEETSPTQPVNPYGESKLVFENALKWHQKAYGIGVVSLRYFNAAGASESNGYRWEGDKSHLIPCVLDVALKKRSEVKIFGTDYNTPDGTCMRDYVHVRDIACAHRLSMESLERGENRVYNLGGNGGCSVKEVVRAAREITGRVIPVNYERRRVGDPTYLVASSERARRELKWTPERSSLERILRDAWAWELKKATENNF